MRYLLNATCIIILVSNYFFSQGQFLQPKSHALGIGYGYQFQENAFLRSYNFSFSLAGYVDVGITSGKGSTKNNIIGYNHYDENFSIYSATVSVHMIKANIEEATAGWLLSLGFQESDYKQTEIVSYAPGSVINTERGESSRLIQAGTSAYISTSVGKFILIPFISAGYSFGDNEDGMFIAGLGSSVGYKISKKFIANFDLNGAVVIESSESIVGLNFGIIWTL